MGDVVALVALNAFKKYTASARPDNNIQTAFKPHEKRTIGDIRTHLMDIGFTKNPTPKFSAYPDQEQQNNRITLEIDVADPKYQKIFGERFKITITKYKDQQNQDIFIMETPLNKSSGNFGHVIRFVEHFIATNLRPEHTLPKALVASL